MMKFFEAAGLFRECWGLYRKYYGRKGMNESVCQQIYDEVEEVYCRYEKSSFAKDMLLAVMYEIEVMDKRD